jgi:hypothetical protein
VISINFWVMLVHLPQDVVEIHVLIAVSTKLVEQAGKWQQSSKNVRRPYSHARPIASNRLPTLSPDMF